MRKSRASVKPIMSIPTAEEPIAVTTMTSSIASVSNALFGGGLEVCHRTVSICPWSVGSQAVVFYGESF